MVKLSIIIPYYNTYEYTRKLLDELEKQMGNNPEIELIVIDDGCNEHRLDDTKNALIVHLDKNSGTASKPRNVGIDMSQGEYITFCDSDDMVSDNYISKILKAIETKPDIVFLSWKCSENTVIMNTQPPKWNCAVWCRVYKRDIIGNVRFDETMKIAEDYKFNQEVKWKTKVCIKDIIYYYTYGREGSLLHERKN